MTYTLYALTILPVFLHLFNISQHIFIINNSNQVIFNLAFLIVFLLMVIILFIKYDQKQTGLIQYLILNQKKTLEASTKKLDLIKNSLNNKKERYLNDKKNIDYIKNIEHNLKFIVQNGDDKSNKDIIILILKKLCEIFHVYTGRCYLYKFDWNSRKQNIISDGNISIIQPKSLDRILEDCIYEKLGNTYYFTTDFVSYSSTSVRNIYHKGIMVIPLVFDGQVISILTFFSHEKINVDVKTVFDTLQSCLKPFIIKVRGLI